MSGQDSRDQAQIPQHARERLADMRAKKLFTSDLSVSEFLLVKEAGFDPVGLVMGTSIYQVVPNIPNLPRDQPGCELVETTRALYHARELAMSRMEAEAEALGADGIVGVRLTVNISTDPQRVAWQQYRTWNDWSRKSGFRRPQSVPTTGWFQSWPDLAASQWHQWGLRLGWVQIPLPPWAWPNGQARYSLGANTAEFIAIGTAVRQSNGQHYRNKHGKPFQSDLSGQDFWMLIKTGYRPVGFVMGNCVYYVTPTMLAAPASRNMELVAYTHALYDARELAIERLQDEAEALDATGVVGVTVAEKQHSWRASPWNVGNAALQTGEIIELFVVGTAVIPAGGSDLVRPTLVFSANDKIVVAKPEGE